MGSVKELFVEKKNELIALLEDGAAYFSTQGNKEDEDSCCSFVKKVREGEFNVIVVGEFSSGKSSFLNALMGRRFLPSWQTETTATINVLRHKNRAAGNYSGCVYYADGSTEELPVISPDVLKKYTSTEGDTGKGKVAEAVKYMDLFFDSPFLEDNVMLVDSPGLNGVADHHREITESQISKSHACIFMFNYEKPGSGTEFEILKTLQKCIPTILFVLNKIDTERTEEQGLNSVIDRIKENYRNQFPEKKTIPHLWSISARCALWARTGIDGEKKLSLQERDRYLSASRMEAFEERLLKFLTQSEKAKAMLETPLTQLEHLLRVEKKKLEDDLAALTDKIDAAGIEAKVSELQEAMKKIEEEKGRIQRELQWDIKRVERDTREEVKAKLEHFRDERLRRLDQWDDLDDLNRILNVRPAFKTYIDEISRDCTETFYDGLRELAFQKYNDLVSLIQGEEHDFNIPINREVPITETEIDFGIEQYMEKITDMEAEVIRKESEIDKMQYDKLATLRYESELKHLKDELKNAKDRKERLEESFTLPPPEYRTKQVKDDFYWRGLLHYVFSTVGFGNAWKTTYHDEEYVDDSVRREAQERFNNLQSEHNQEIKKREDELLQMKSSGASAEEIELNITQREKAIEIQRQKIKEERARQLEEFERRKKKKISQIKRDMTDYLDNMSTDIFKAFDKEIVNIGKQNAVILTELLVTKAGSQLKRKQEEIENQKVLLEASEQDKKSKIDEKAALLKKVHALLSRTIEMESVLSAQTVDKLEEEVI